MKPVLTPQQAAELDRASQARGIRAVDLMETAGRAVARATVDLLGGVYGRRASVVCGKGNNGGDGLVAARHLARWGVRVAVHLIEPPDSLREPAAENLRRLSVEAGVAPTTFSSHALRRDLGRSDVVVDAVFGTGFRGMPEDDWLAAIEHMNAADAPVVSVDIPSGVNGATGAVEGAAVWAELTVTFGAAKVGAVLLPGADRAGMLRVVDIGFPDDLIDADVWLTEPGDVASSIPTRDVDSHKRASGVLLVVAGSREMTGAVRLIAEAAARVGAGLVKVAVPLGILDVVESSITEATFRGLPQTQQGTIHPRALDPLAEDLNRAHALVLGPGLTAHEETSRFARELLQTSPVPTVLDADGLNAFAGRAQDLADRKAEAVLTPHLGEFGRLTGVSVQDVERDRLAHARRLSAAASAVTLLKGSRTVVTEPGGEARVNLTGSPVLATAGSGDVLAGMLGGLLARGVPAFDAASSAAYLHGLAGLLAGRDLGDGTLAGDLLARIPQAIERIVGSA